MMGGIGSGRPGGSGRDTVEACRSINVNRLHREGCLRAGWMVRQERPSPKQAANASIHPNPTFGQQFELLPRLNHVMSRPEIAIGLSC